MPRFRSVCPTTAFPSRATWASVSGTPYRWKSPSVLHREPPDETDSRAARRNAPCINGRRRADVSCEAVHALHGLSLLAHRRRAADAVRTAALTSRAVDNRRQRVGAGG